MNNPNPETILIVDDDPASLKVLFEYLRGFGFKVLTARDGESGLQLANKNKPDMILLDVRMSGLDGFEVCRRLKDRPETNGIPIIFITSLSNTTDQVKGFKLGAADYVVKPIRCEEVLVRINTQLKARALQKQLSEQNKELREENVRRRRVQEALQESRERYRLLAENSTDIISRQTPEGVYRYVSPACLTLLGYKVEEMIGRSTYDFFHPEDLPAIQEADLSETDPPPVAVITYRARRSDDTYVWLETTNRIIYDPQANVPIEIIAVSRNITERKEAEAALQEARNQLEQRVAERTAELATANLVLQDEIAERKRAEAEIQAYSEELQAKNEALSRLDKIKDEFLANTSHELRTPLNGIIGIAESMIDGATGGLTPQQLYNLSMVVTSGRRLTSLVNDTLDFSKLKHEELDLSLESGRY